MAMSDDPQLQALEIPRQIMLVGFTAVMIVTLGVLLHKHVVDKDAGYDCLKPLFNELGGRKPCHYLR
jgi:hypothetical protein